MADFGVGSVISGSKFPIVQQATKGKEDQPLQGAAPAPNQANANEEASESNVVKRTESEANEALGKSINQFA